MTGPSINYLLLTPSSPAQTWLWESSLGLQISDPLLAPPSLRFPQETGWEACPGARALPQLPLCASGPGGTPPGVWEARGTQRIATAQGFALC